MPIKFTCDQCSHEHTVKSEHAGKKIKCKGCGEPIRIPKAGGGSTKSSSRKAQKKSGPADSDYDFLGALNAAAKDQGKVIPKKPSRKEIEEQELQESLKAANKKAIIGGIVTILGLMVVIGIKLVRRTDIVDRVSGSDSAAVEQAGGGAAVEGGESVEIAGGAMTITLPGQPQANESAASDKTITMYQLQANGLTLNIASIEYDLEKLSEEDRSKLNVQSHAQHYVDYTLKSQQSVNDSLKQSETTIGGIPALRLELEAVNGDAHFHMTAVHCCVGNRQFSILLVDNTDQEHADQVEAILNSIRFSDEAVMAFQEMQGA